MDNSSGNIDQRLLQAYQQTVYRVLEPGIDIRIGRANPVLDAFLQENDARTWAFITAWNPRSQLLSERENNQRHQELVKMMDNSDYPYFLGKGIGEDSSWQPELSLFILNMSKKEAIEIATYFNQYALVFGERGGLPTLLII